MNKKWIAGILLAGSAIGLAGCGGGGGGETKDTDTSVGTLHPDTGTDTDPPPNSGNDGSGGNNSGDDSGSQDPGGNPSGGSGGNSGPDNGGTPGGDAGGNNGGDNGNSEPPPGDTGSGPVHPCANMIGRCLDVANTQLTKYKDNKQAAASYTFDDGYQTSFQIASLFESRDLRASFYIVPSTVADDDWARWKNLLANGHEIGTHSMTHTIDLGMPDVTDEQLDVEITQAQALITQRIGIKPEVFAFPWHSYNARSRSLALKTHMAIRSRGPDDTDYTLSFFDNDHYPTPAQTLEAVNEELKNSVASGGWFVAAGHGLDGDGWSPVTTQFMIDHLDFAKTYANKLWTDTYLNVARYRICRKAATAQASIDSSQQVTVRITGNYDPAVCTAPMTVVIPLLESPPQSMKATRADGSAVPLKFIGGKLLVNVVPGDEVCVKTGNS